eukprot:g6489.t1
MEQMGPLNYKIRGRGKVQIVNVRRLIKYDPFLLEDESVEEALKRMKEDFKEVPPISKEDTLEEENAYRAPVSEKEETEKESKEDSNRKSAAGTQSKAPIVRGDEVKQWKLRRARRSNVLRSSISNKLPTDDLFAILLFPNQPYTCRLMVNHDSSCGAVRTLQKYVIVDTYYKSKPHKQWSTLL